MLFIGCVVNVQMTKFFKFLRTLLPKKKKQKRVLVTCSYNQYRYELHGKLYKAKSRVSTSLVVTFLTCESIALSGLCSSVISLFMYLP